jgi:tRNA(fMet)-specific endonuclease VapC
MNGRYLLDTNIVIRLLNADAAIVRRAAQTDEFRLCAIVLGELVFGALKSRAVASNLAKIQELASRGTVLACDENTANEYGAIKNALRSKGRPIPENDIWVAALARQYNLALATRDEHFAEVDGLTLDRW